MTTKYATMTVANCEAEAEIARLRTAARHTIRHVGDMKPMPYELEDAE